MSDLQKAEFEFYAGIFSSDNIREEMLANAKRLAKNNGLEVTFEGEYRQAISYDSDVEMPTQFVIAQTEEEKGKLKQGVLEGRVIEMDSAMAFIRGTINSIEVNFEKRYREHPFFCLNPNPISYSGASKDGKIYRGKWNFESDVGNMAREGKFELRRI